MNKDFEPGVFVEHFIKDMGIALEEAGRMNLSLPGLKLVKEIYDKSVEYNLTKKGTQALYLILDKVSNR
ncbi:NAD-binding protein [Bacteroidota bacterium]